VVDNLFETVGGRGTISAAVDSFYRRVLADVSVQHFFRSVDMEHLRARQSMFISMLLGGRVVYTGKDISAAHDGARNLGLNDSHFDTILMHFRASLMEVGVEADKVEKIMVLLEGTRKAVLNR
jgi:hemoglobin